MIRNLAAFARMLWDEITTRLQPAPVREPVGTIHQQVRVIAPMTAEQAAAEIARMATASACTCPPSGNLGQDEHHIGCAEAAR